MIEPLVREMKIDTSDFLENEIIEIEDEIIRRVELFKNYVETFKKDQTILVITHSDFIQHHIFIMMNVMENIRKIRELCLNSSSSKKLEPIPLYYN